MNIPTYQELEDKVLKLAVKLANAESKYRALAAENTGVPDDICVRLRAGVTLAQSDIEMLRAALRNAPAAPSDNQGRKQAGALQNCRSNENVQVLNRQSVVHVDGEPAATTQTVAGLSSMPRMPSCANMKSTLVNDITTGKQLTITLPDISSKAFWSGMDKHEVFHPETYKRWVKDAIERDCCIAGIEVRVK